MVGSLGLSPLGPVQRALIAESLLDTSLEGVKAKLHFVIAKKTLVTPELTWEEALVNSSPGAITSMRLISRYFRNCIDRYSVLESLTDLSSRLRMLLISGELDRVVAPNITSAASQALYGEATIIEGAGHVPYWEEPTTFNRAVADFLC
jgi:pimeloyl-ACP methyl ester carboxylesterase